MARACLPIRAITKSPRAYRREGIPFKIAIRADAAHNNMTKVVNLCERQNRPYDREPIYYGAVEIVDVRTLETVIIENVVFKASNTVRDLLPYIRRTVKGAVPENYRIKQLRTDTARKIGDSNI